MISLSTIIVIRNFFDLCGLLKNNAFSSLQVPISFYGELEVHKEKPKDKGWWSQLSFLSPQLENHPCSRRLKGWLSELQRKDLAKIWKITESFPQRLEARAEIRQAVHQASVDVGQWVTGVRKATLLLIVFFETGFLLPPTVFICCYLKRCFIQTRKQSPMMGIIPQLGKVTVLPEQKRPYFSC